MKSRPWLLPALLAGIIVAQQAYLMAPAIQRWVFPPPQEKALEGVRLVQDLACFACHGAEGGGGIINPGADVGKKVVPALAGGEIMMWADSEEEIRQWILNGRPDDEKPEQRSGVSAGQGTGRALVMPAYKDHLNADELDSLMLYIKAISGLQFPEEGRTRAGFELAHELGCFRCHGPMGVGGVANPGSLKGYVPGFTGEDYTELVQSPAEAAQWIRDGVSQRFQDNPLAYKILERQVIKMPAYGAYLSDGQIDSLVAVVDWLNKGQWRQMPVP
ncbi:MAG TPA: c-type cytochrome [Candidatus Binatia bacterium]|nr:c-type cytochrome [Candidatus Binatia bacterium]